MLKKIRWRTAGVILAALALAGGGAGVAAAVTAQATASAGVVITCVANTTGAVRVVNSADQCRVSEHPVELAASQAPRTVSVDCAAGGSISQVLADEPVLPPLTIEITGTCTEAVSINRDNVTLRAAAPGAGIKSPTPSDTVLTVSGTHIDLLGITISGGGTGLFATGAAVVNADNLHVTGAASGIGLDDSASARLTNVTVDNFTGVGLAVSNGASADVSDSEITGPGADSAGDCIVMHVGGHANIYQVHVTDCRVGVQVTASVALLQNSVIEHDAVGVRTHAGGILYMVGAFIQDNRDRGVEVSSGNMFLQDTHVANNGGGGAEADAGSLEIAGGSIIENNRGDGVVVAANGTATIYGTIIRGNSGNGVFVGDTSIADFPQGNTEITGNSGTGILCQGPPAVALIRGNTGTVTGNTQGQIDCPPPA